jgi:hypothetical protein
LLAAYDLITSVDGPSTTKQELSAGIFYTGRRDLSLGLAAMGSLVSNEGDLSQKIAAGRVTMRYLW